MNTEAGSDPPHVFVAVCGYEARAVHAISRFGHRAGAVLVLDYESDGVLSYDKNKVTFRDDFSGRFLPLKDGVYAEELATCLNQILSGQKLSNGNARLYFDVSCGSRRVISNVLLLLHQRFSGQFNITCLYSISQYYSPPKDELPSHISEPVVGELAGWSDDLYKPPCAVVGLGFEPGRAIGCLDYLEIPEARLFFPLGVDQRFEGAVQAANSVLIDELGSDSVLHYRVSDPSDTYAKLTSLVTGIEAWYRPVLIPLGPKIFAAVCIVLAIRKSPNVCVWRTSAGNLAAPHDAIAEGFVSRFDIGKL